jgi:hypothetical protein
MDAPRSRPLGISILAVVNAIEGVVQIWTGTMFLGFGIAALFTIEKNAVGGTERRTASGSSSSASSC